MKTKLEGLKSGKHRLRAENSFSAIDFNPKWMFTKHGHLLLDIGIYEIS